MCHEYEYGLMHTHIDQVRYIFENALQSYWKQIQNKTYLKPKISKFSSIIGNYNDSTYLPLVPDVAIHYRCGDNLIGHYGFLPFSAFKNLIPDRSKYIYVMCEHMNRYKRPDQKVRCELVLSKLHSYLSSLFPSAVVLLLRGQNVYRDLYRLTHANTTICSVSTFCFYPALSSKTTAYFPVTRLVAKATKPNYGEHFKWITTPKVFPGVRARELPNHQLIKILQST